MKYQYLFVVGVLFALPLSAHSESSPGIEGKESSVEMSGEANVNSSEKSKERRECKGFHRGARRLYNVMANAKSKARLAEQKYNSLKRRALDAHCRVPTIHQ